MTRIGVLSDVHANLHALEAALAALEGVDALACPGDLIGYGPFPNECAARVLDAADVVVAGNHELIALGELDLDRCTPLARDSLLWTREQLRPEVAARLRALPRRAGLGDGIVVAHGSYDDPQRYVRTVEQARSSLARLPEGGILLVGHTHAALAVAERSGELLREASGTVRLPEGERILLNPGAVGQARGGRARAWVMVLDTADRTAEFRTVRYDVRAAKRALRERGLPEESVHIRDTLRDRVGRVRARLRAA